MPELLILLPAAILALGAIGLRTLAPRLPTRRRQWVAPLLLGLTTAAVIVNMAPFPHRLVLSLWESASFALALEMTGAGSLLLPVMLVILGVLWLVEPARPWFDHWSAWILTTAVLVVLAGDVITLYFAWVLLDVVLLLWRHAHKIDTDTALRSLALSQLAGLAFFAGSQFASTPYAAAGTALVSLAFWARLGLFPFHWLYPAHGGDSRDWWIARGVPLLTSASVWIRWPTFYPDAPDRSLVFLAALAMAAAAIWVWREEQPARIVVAGVSHILTLVPVAILYGGDAGIAFALWLTLSAALGLALFELALRWRAENRNRWARILWFAGMLSIAGIPLTPAFLGRVGVYVSLWESGDWWLTGIALVATTLVLAPFWSFGLVLEASESRDPRRHEYAGLGILAGVFLLFSLLPWLITPALAPEMSSAMDAAILRVIRTNDAIGVAVGFAVLVLPVILGFLLRNRAKEFHPHPRGLMSRTARALDLEWLEPVITGIGYQMGATARNLSALAEENPTVWILLVALWVAIFVTIPR